MKEFIKEIKERSDSDMRGSKNDLAEFAMSLGVNLKKNRSLDNMILDLESELSDLPEEIQEDFNEVEEVASVNPIPDDIIEVQYNIHDHVEETVVYVESEVAKVQKETILAHEDIYVFTGYLTVPYWINDWIQSTDKWKNTICPWKGSEKHIRTILYWIAKDGQIQIRETRNSQVITLD